jgi:hypothetical protein
MVKQIFALLFFLTVFNFSHLHAQILDLSIPSGELPSDIATWQDKPDLLHLSFAIPDGIELDNAHIIFEVTEGVEHILISTRTKFRDQPPLSGKFKKKSFTFNDLVNSESIDIDPSVKSPSSVLGKLPGGFFGICFFLVDSSGKPITSIYQGCTNFFVRDVDPPTAITPQNEATLSLNAPLTFSWTPAHVISQQVHYEFKIYPIYQGQTPDQAMASSSAIYKSDDIFSTTFLYPSDAPKLSALINAKGFAWIVTQLNQDGKTIGKNYGRSIPSVFYKNAEGK